MGTRQLDRDLLLQFPWYSGVPGPHRTIPDNSPYAPLLNVKFTPLVQVSSSDVTFQISDKRIVAAERHYLNTAPPGALATISGTLGLDSVLIPSHALLQSILSNNQASASSNKVSQLASWLLRYRLFDVLEWISSPDYPRTPSGQPFKYPIPYPGKIFYKEMADWPNLLNKALLALQATTYFDGATHDSDGEPVLSQDAITSQLLTSLSSRVLQTNGHFVICNFECATLYLNILSRLEDHKADLPPSAQEFREYLDSHIPSAEWDSFFEKLQKTQTFKLPLHMALAISPLCLFLPTQLMFKEANRLNLLLMWQGLGGPRPQSLQAVEVKIFQALADVAFGMALPRPRFAVLFQELREMDFTHVPIADRAWLAADPKFLSRVAPEYYTPADPSQISFSLPTPTAHVGHTTVIGPGSGAGFAHLEAPFDPPLAHDNTVGGEGQPPSIADVLPDPRIATSHQRPAYQDGPLQRPKRTRKNITIVHQTVDLSAEREVILMHEVRAAAHDDQVYRASQRCFGGPPAVCCFSPEFRSIQELEMFQKFWNTVGASQRSCTPSQIDTVPHHLVETWGVADAQSAIRTKDIVVTGIRGLGDDLSSQFNESNLKTIASLQRIIPAKDFSLPRSERGVHILLKDVLEAASASPSRIVGSDYFPVPDALIYMPRGIASDMMAWDATINQPWCRLHEYPRGTMRFASVSTSSAYEGFHVAVHGFGVYLEVQAGSIWLLIGRNSDQDSVKNAECVHLSPGSGIVIRPGTPFFSLTTSNCIARGSYWYASSSLSATVTSIIRDFLAPDFLSLATDKSSRVLLRRLVHFYHMVYTSGLFFKERQSDECAHTPDVTSTEGLENLLSLCNLMELENIVAGDDYTRDGIPEPERQEIIEARRVCRTIVDWVRRHFSIHDSQTEREVSLNDDVWMPFLARYIKVIQESKMNLAKSRLAHAGNAQNVLGAINEAFSSNAKLLRCLNSLNLSAVPDPLVFPGFRRLHITRRDSPLPDDRAEMISGENGSDVTHHRVLRSLIPPV